MTQLTDAARHAILDVYERLLYGWNRQSADDFAAAFTDDASCVGFDGSPMNGRAQIATELRKIFESHRTASYLGKVRELRELTHNVVLLRAVVGMVPPGANDISEKLNAVQSVVLIQVEQTWQVALLHNTPAAFDGRPELAEQLSAELRALLRTGKTVDAPH